MDIPMQDGPDDHMVDDALTIARLSLLSPMEYDRVRRSEAARLSIRPDTLDAQVKRFRNDNATAEISDAALHEDGIALAFAAKFQHELRYCHTSNAWFKWDGAIWQREKTRLAFAWARDVCREMADRGDLEEGVRASLAKANTAASVERFAAADRRLAVTFDVWDKDPWLLGTPAGTVNLRTGKLEPGSVSDHITRSTSVAPATPGTAHPVWSAFLNDASRGDTDMQQFLKRLVGYLLTGDISEEMLAFIYGKGGNGKGVFLGAFAAIMGGYAVSVPIEVFTANSRINLEYYRAQMAGARLVTASETEAGATWAESQIKEMTGNETPLSARQPYGQVFNFKPQFKITLVGNHAPKLKGRTPAMERRLRVLPFTNAPQNPDKHLKEKLQAEYPAILQWAIEGCLEWQKGGLGTCAVVATATGAYFEQQDGFARWIEERCVLADTLSTKPGALHADHTSWARANGEDVMNRNEFAEIIERTDGLRRAKTNGVRLVHGIGLQTPDEGDRYDR